MTWAKAEAQTTARSSWPSAGLVVVAALLVLIWLFRDTARETIQTWLNDSTYGHGFLVLPVSGALIWLRRGLLARLTPRACPWGLALVALAAFVWLGGNLSGLLVVQQLALVAMMQALVLTVLGGGVFRALLFPMGFLYFAVPLGDFLISPLQQLTAQAVVPMIRLSGVAVYLDGLYISIPAGTFEVAEACAGLRFLISTVMIGTLLANLFYRSARRRALILLAAIVIPILANALRAYGIIMIGQLAGMEFAAGTDHLIYGFIFLAVVTLVLLAVAYGFRETVPEGLGAPLPPQDLREPYAVGRPLGLLAAGVAALAIAAAAPVYASLITPGGSDAPPRLLAGPEVGGPWRPVAAVSAWRPRFVGHLAEADQAYAADGRRLRLRIYYYDHQRQGAEIINDQNELFEGRQARRMGAGRQGLRVDGAALEVRTERWANVPGNLLVAYWYWVDGRFVADPLPAKLLELKAKLLGGVPAAAVVALAVPFEESPGEAVVVIQDFLDHVEPLGGLLAAGGSG